MIRVGELSGAMRAFNMRLDARRRAASQSLFAAALGTLGRWGVGRTAPPPACLALGTRAASWRCMSWLMRAWSIMLVFTGSCW